MAFEQNPKNMVGWGNVSYWPRVDSAKLAEVLTANGLNSTHIEMMRPDEAKYWRKENVGKCLDDFARFAKPLLDKSITIVLNVFNWNLEGRENACNCFTSPLAGQIIDGVKAKVGMAGINFQIASEWGPGCRNSKCWQQADRCHGVLNTRWQGAKSWNKQSRPTTAPRGYYPEWHIMSLVPRVPKGLLILTDTGNVLKQLGAMSGRTKNLAKLKELAKTCRKCGSGFIHYGYELPTGDIDEPAIVAIRQGWFGK